MTRFSALGAVAAFALLGAVPALARDQIRIVGSSTVYPFTTAVAEQFGKTSGMKTPVVESTGTGGGMKLFCDGVGVSFPDATNASRRMKTSELDSCTKNGVTAVIEMMVGYDGLTIAHSKKAKALKLTRGQLFLALAKEVPGADGKLVANPYKTWKQIDAALPDLKIEVLGPPPTSGTRDSLHELVMEPGAEQIPAMKALKAADRKAFDKAWKTIRDDGAFVEAGENDNVIVQKLEANPTAFGIFGYSFLEENVSKIQGVTIDGVEPTMDTISALKYGPSRELFVYIKKQHIGVVPGLEKFAAEYVSDKAAGEAGYLEKKGLVPVPAEKLAASRANIAAQKVLATSDLK